MPKRLSHSVLFLVGFLGKSNQPYYTLCEEVLM